MTATIRRHGPPTPLIATATSLGRVGMLRADGSGRALDALGVLLGAVACFALLAPRRAPLAVCVFSSAASAAINLLG